MRKKNCLRLLLTAAAGAALPLMAINAHATAGDIYETNNGMILRFSPGGGNPGTFAQNLANPKGLVFDGNGHVFMASAGNGTILRFSTISGSAFTFASGLSSPVGLAIEVSGAFLFESDAGSGNIFKFVLADGTKTTFASGLGGPAGLAFDGSGNLFAAEFSAGTISKIASDGTKTTFASGLSFPAGLAIDTSNNLFEADSGTGTIFKFAPDGTKTTFASGLTTPYGLAFDATGNLIVADNGNGSTFRYSPAGVQTTVFSSDFNTPQFVAVEPAPHQLLNMSTRGFIQGGDHILIAGFIVGGTGPVGTTVVVRAIGPSLSTAGVSDPLPDPLLGVRDSNGALVAFNDDWQDAPLEQRVAGALAPSNAHESALQLVLNGGSYTAIVTSADGTTPGTALVEVYNVP
jgi:sugar lactone lactonase YvrE